MSESISCIGSRCTPTEFHPPSRFRRLASRWTTSTPESGRANTCFRSPLNFARARETRSLRTTWITKSTASSALTPTSDLVSRMRRELNKRHGLNAGYIETFAASHVLAHDLIVQQDHVAGSLLEFGAITLVGLARQAVHLGSDQPTQ